MVEAELSKKSCLGRRSGVRYHPIYIWVSVLYTLR